MEHLAEQKRQERKLRIALIFILVAVALVGLTRWYLDPKYADLQTSIKNTASIVRDIDRVERQRDGYLIQLEKTGKSYENLSIAKDDHIAFIGKLAMDNDMNINKMTVDDITAMDKGMTSMKVELELQGNLYNVKNLIQAIYSSDKVIRINSFSYRLESQTDLLWMWREIDDVTLVPWWDITNQDGSISINGSVEEERPPLGADDLLHHGTALCYMEIEFLGVGG